MIISDIKTKPYRLDLKSNWVTSSGQSTYRQGFIVTIEADHRLCGQGDCAPLQGTENLQQASDYLHHWASEIKSKSVDELLDQPLPISQYPAASFALETALLDLKSQQLDCSPAQLLNPAPAREVKLNTMIGHLDSSIIEAALAAQQQGYQILKIKVGVYPIQQELNTLQHLIEQLQPQTRLRLDANQAWTLDDAQRFLDGLNPFTSKIDSLEEPLKELDWTTLQQLQDSTQVELALDESLPLFLSEQPLEELPVKRTILKPSRLGGLRPAYKLAQQAKIQGISCVVTSALESNIGLNACIQLASALDNQQYHGLATASWFKNNIGNTPEISSARISL